MVAVRIWVRGGARVERLPGQALVAGRALAEGTARRGWRQIAEEAEARGMALGSFGSFEIHGVGVDALAADWELAVDWAAELILEASFPEDRCRWIARQAAAELESLTDQPEVETALAFLDQLYAPHPRSRPLHGSAASLGELTSGKCAGFHRRALAGGVIATLAGTVDEDVAARRLEDAFSDLRGRAAGAPEPPPIRGRPEPWRRVETGARDQAHLYLGKVTVSRLHADHPALELAGVILGAGAGLAGRIPQRIREREGLAYAAQAAAAAGAGLDPGRFVAYAGTAPAMVARAEAAAREELARLVADGVTEDELAGARSYLLGQEPFHRETARQWAEILAEAELYGLPLDRPEWWPERLLALDRRQVEEAVRTHLDPQGLRVTVGVPRPRRRARE